MIAILMSENASESSCVWYFINMVIETSLGMIIAYILIKAVNCIAFRLKIYSLVSGNYVRDGNGYVELGSWVLQLIVWGLIIMIVIFM